jgi:phosphotransferase system HPr (HPr) family protein
MKTVDVRVASEAGLHARPAARFVELASAFSARVEISNLTRGTGPANAKSIISILSLGVSQGHDVRVAAEGEDADAALERLRDELLAEPPGSR